MHLATIQLNLTRFRTQSVSFVRLAIRALAHSTLQILSATNQSFRFPSYVLLASTVLLVQNLQLPLAMKDISVRKVLFPKSHVRQGILVMELAILLLLWYYVLQGTTVLEV